MDSHSHRHPARPKQKDPASYWGDLNLRPSKPRTRGLPAEEAAKLIRRFAREDE
jgi:hypothetical protein